MRIICNVLIFKYYIKNRALWSIPVFIKKVNDMQLLEDSIDLPDP